MIYVSLFVFKLRTLWGLKKKAILCLEAMSSMEQFMVRNQARGLHKGNGPRKSANLHQQESKIAHG